MIIILTNTEAKLSCISPRNISILSDTTPSPPPPPTLPSSSTPPSSLPLPCPEPLPTARPCEGSQTVTEDSPGVGERGSRGLVSQIVEILWEG